jgi:hypothetical protein
MYLFVCVCARVSECKRVRAWGARVGMAVGTRARVYAAARVVLLIQNATRMRHIVHGLSGSTIFVDFMSYTTRCSRNSYGT